VGECGPVPHPRVFRAELVNLQNFDGMPQKIMERKKAFETFVWNDASEPSMGGIFFIPGKRLKVRITDEATWIKWKSEGI
jgi:hypothetical protein